MQNTAKTHQNKSKFRIVEYPVGFTKGSPVLVSGDFIQRDLEIDYLHTHHIPEIGLCKSGHGIWIIEDRILPFSMDDVVYIDAHVPHLAQSSKGTQSTWVWIYCDSSSPELKPYERVSFLRSQSGDFPSYTGGSIYPQRKFPSIHSLVSAIIEEGHHPTRYSQDVLVYLCFALDLINLGNAQEPYHLSNPATARRNRIALQRVSSAVQHIAVHYGETIRLPHLAYLCCMSCANFGRQFVRATGMAPRDYLVKIRMSMAQTEFCSSSDRRIIDIAEACGFPSISSFNRMFRNTFKMTPREYRKRAMGSGMC